ncbi:MAG TPA: hypothetical protein VK191_10435 [Symbiobacteriaceae bacterium]|nr:hypothetical protein [Symbiobacteriaceae bacterium]
MNEQERRLLAQAVASERPVLVNPTDEELRAAAEALRLEGRLVCSHCHEPIREPEFRSQRVELGPKLQAVAHTHLSCEPGTH